GRIEDQGNGGGLMCVTCGCSDPGGATLTDLQTGTVLALGEPHDHTHSHAHHHHHHHEHGHEHAHPHDHGHHHSHTHGATIDLEQQIVARNNQLAERNRGWLTGRRVLALNLVSSPGAGKTTLLERTIRELGKERTLSVIEGDQQTLNDARRIQATGCKVVQIN